jgi:hypothetical protein
MLLSGAALLLMPGFAAAAAVTGLVNVSLYRVSPLAYPGCTNMVRAPPAHRCTRTVTRRARSGGRGGAQRGRVGGAPKPAAFGGAPKPAAFASDAPGFASRAADARGVRKAR